MKIEDLLVLAASAGVLYFVWKKNNQTFYPANLVQEQPKGVTQFKDLSAEDQAYWTPAQQVKLWGAVTGGVIPGFPDLESMYRSNLGMVSA